MEQSQKLTFASIFYQNVAGLSADDFPGHRITLQAEDETSCSTSHASIFFQIFLQIGNQSVRIQKKIYRSDS